jgi:hypothetical protein
MTATRNTTAAAALRQAESLTRKGLKALDSALTAFRDAGPALQGVVGLLQRAQDVGNAVAAQLRTDLAKAQTDAEQPMPNPAPKAEQPKPAPAPAVTLPNGWEAMPAAVLAGFFAALGGVAPRGGLDRNGLVAAIRELVAKQAAVPAPVAKPETPAPAPKAEQLKAAAKPATADQPARKPAAPKGDGLAAFRAAKAECKALGLPTTGKLPELQARLAEAKAKGATASAAKAAIPSDAELAKLGSMGLVALFRKLPVELQRELLAAAR